VEGENGGQRVRPVRISPAIGAQSGTYTDQRTLSESPQKREAPSLAAASDATSAR